jgi:hypothetical protein
MITRVRCLDRSGHRGGWLPQAHVPGPLPQFLEASRLHPLGRVPARDHSHVATEWSPKPCRRIGCRDSFPSRSVRSGLRGRPSGRRIVAMTTERPTDVRTLEDACQARVLAVNGTAFPEPHVPVAPGDEVQVVGTGRGLDELERRVAPPAASDANERDETALGAGIFFRGARSPSRTAGRPPLRIGRPCPLPRLGPARSYRSAFRLWGRRPPRARGNRP